MSPVLFVAYGGGHVAMLAPVALALSALGRPFVFLALTTAKGALDRLGIPSIGFRDLPEATDERAQHWGRELESELASGGGVEVDETIAYLGANFRDLIDEFGEVEARRRYAECKRQAFLPVNTLRRVLLRLQPALVVATNSPRAERAAILAAGQLGIPSVCAVDLFALQEVQWIGQLGYASRICVLNETVRQMFLSHGRGSDELVVTGNPAFDALVSPTARQTGIVLRHSRGWNDGCKLILWASQIEPERHPFASLFGDPSLPRRVESRLRQLVSMHPNLHLVVRYHPSERVEFEPAPGVSFSPVSEPLSALLHAVDVVVVTASTVGLEAAIAGRPVVSIDTSVFTPDTRYASLGISKAVTELDDLGPAIFAALAGAGSVFEQGQSGKSATQEVLRVINSLLV